jgi:predicted nicotinamide N-methyase
MSCRIITDPRNSESLARRGRSSQQSNGAGIGRRAGVPRLTSPHSAYRIFIVYVTECLLYRPPKLEFGDAMMTTQEERPFSPTARAFFAALDDKDSAGSHQQKKKTKPQSESIQKRVHALGWRNRYSQDDDYPLTVGAHSFSVRQVQRGEIDGTYGTGATVWPASLVLIKYLEKTGLVAGRHVVDLGAGTGVTSIAAALLGAASCVCTDGEEPVVRLSRDNIRAVAQTFRPDVEHPIPNEVEPDEAHDGTITILNCPISTQQYWWGTGSIDSEHACDVILVSDCVLPKLYPIAPLVEALSQLLRPARADGHTATTTGAAATADATTRTMNNQHGGAIALLSYEYRFFPDYDPKEKFMELCAAKGLAVTCIPRNEQHDVYALDDVELWKVSCCPLTTG